jgi:hypothetical protein
MGSSPMSPIRAASCWRKRASIALAVAPRCSHHHHHPMTAARVASEALASIGVTITLAGRAVRSKPT